MTNKFESKCLQIFYASSKKKCYRKTSSYLEHPSRHFCQHFTRRTDETRNPEQTFLAINLANQQKTKKVYFSSEVRKQFKLLTVPLKPSRCCLRSDTLVNCQVWRFFKDLYLNFRVIWSVNPIVLKMVSSLILLRSLRVYILKQSLFSISVSSGFRNIYLAANGQPPFTSISKNNC